MPFSGGVTLNDQMPVVSFAFPIDKTTGSPARVGVIR
jgi:hypothetical protein